MKVQKSALFIADIEQGFEWYAVNASWAVAERYLNAIQITCRLIGRYPHLGPVGHFVHPRLRQWRHFVVSRPFNNHVLFYEIGDNDVVMRRAMHGYRDLPRRLAEPGE